MTEKLLIKFLNNNCTVEEVDEVIRWISTKALTNDSKNLGFQDWKSYKEDKNIVADEKINSLLDKIHHKINIDQGNQKMLESKTSALSIITTWLTKVAAILLIPVLVFSTWYYLSSKSGGFNATEQHMAQSWVEINAPDGARVEFLLPDSSRGWLNSGSKLKYPVIFSEERKVELIGEAWFDVKHIDEKGFVVSVDDMDVKVLGTQFDISAYSDDDFTNVVLEEGKVEVNGKAGMFHQVLAPNEKIAFNRKSRSLKVSEVDARRFSAWKEGYLIVDNEPLGDVIGRVERWYNVDIHIQDEVLKGYRFKATFKNEPLEEILRLMAKTTPIVYKIEKRSEDSNGVLKQKKVTIKLKQ